jgi:hypothetical protein
MEQEAAYIAALTQATGFQVSGDQLELTVKTTDPVSSAEVVVILLVFQRVY